MRDLIVRPRSLPPVMGMIVGNSGEMWLRRSHPLEAVSLWLRVRADGTMRDSVAVPERRRIVRLAGPWLWLASADADGIETLMRCTTR
jgi:hypothetical protein